ncbi:MAG: glycine cleavage H-protein-domain-containing protein [Piptocephalis tieghemiana]|nr:MAG: glycine cleavage H-protein-domain-containing protein [Piptocephalis tieghemiana]
MSLRVLSRFSARPLRQMASPNSWMHPAMMSLSRPAHLFTRTYVTRRYTDQHEWVTVDDKGVGTIGITDYAQKSLGDFVYVELPETISYKKDERIGVVESVKAASDIYSPLTGEVIEVNKALSKKPGQINRDPLGEGWICRLKLQDPSEFEGLMDEEAYTKHCQD